MTYSPDVYNNTSLEEIDTFANSTSCFDELDRFNSRKSHVHQSSRTGPFSGLFCVLVGLFSQSIYDIHTTNITLFQAKFSTIESGHIQFNSEARKRRASRLESQHPLCMAFESGIIDTEFSTPIGNL